MVDVSIVIPTLNEEDSLPNCLYNLENQLTEGDEVIVVDGGSDDRTVDLAENYGCRVFIAEDSSIGMARNIGTKRSKNEVIISMDADSIPPQGYVRKVKDHFDTDSELVVLWGTIVDENGTPIRNMIGKFSTVLGGASGNGTSFRKSAYEELEKKYPDINFLEDVAIIHRLSRMGKSKRDKDLVMVMDMDRKRYQTIPMMITGSAIYGLGRYLGGSKGELMKGASAGLIGTEMTYEGMSDTPFHHDQLGMALSAVGRMSNTSMSQKVIGAGLGMVAHHDLTEGISMLPSELQKNTEVVKNG